jgi:hypothetical protein
MFDEVVYHGTNKERGARILKNKIMEVSTGDKHWLGDGSYFFEEDFYSYKWIEDMCKNRYPDQPLEEALEANYQVLSANIVTERSRILDLTKAEYKILYDEVYNELDKMKEYSKRFKVKEIAEGIVLNYMFNELSFGDDYDAVQAIFMLNSKNYKQVHSRIGYMPQKQVCVKNQGIVKDIKDYEYAMNIPKYRELIENLYFLNEPSQVEYYNKNKTSKYTQPGTYNRKGAYTRKYKV